MSREEHKKPRNSSMASNEKEIEELGKEMEHLNTNKQVKEDGHQPDPEQHRQ
jgi:hypothetical protein